MIVFGAAILVAVGGYYGFGLYGASKLDELNVVIDGPVSLPELPAQATETTEIHGALTPDTSFKPINTVATSPEAFYASGGVAVNYETVQAQSHASLKSFLCGPSIQSLRSSPPMPANPSMSPLNRWPNSRPARSSLPTPRR